MVRKLFKSLLSLSLIAPLSAFAIGLGDVHLHSALGERLQADIDLLSVTPAEANSINVSLASQDTFDKVGLERPSILLFLKFEVEQTSSGKHHIKVTSLQPINEPFLDFLVEVNWKSGRVLREYTLLLDPPSGYRDEAPSVMAPSTTTATPSEMEAATPEATMAKEGAAPMAEGEAPMAMEGEKAPMAGTGGEMETESGMETEADRETVLAALRDASSQNYEQAPASRRRGTAAAPASRSSATRTASTAPRSSGDMVYGPVTANETLWSIANKMRPADVSVQQMMVALLKSNPYAFVDNNINRLKRGYVLRIDDPAMLRAMSKADAIREVSSQTRAWQDYRGSVASRAKQRPTKVAASASTPAASATVKKEPKLKLVSPTGKKGGVTGGIQEGKGSGNVDEELALALEASAAQRKENEELKKRLSALEGQLDEMDKLVKLKNDDLAALKAQLAKQGKTVEQPPVQGGGEEAAKPAGMETGGEIPATTGKPGAQIEKSETPPGGEIKPDEAAVMQTEQAKPGETKPAGTKPEAKQPAKPETKKPASKPKRPVIAPAPQPEPSMLDMVLDDVMANLTYVIAGVVGLLLVVLLMVVVRRRRRKGGFQESILNVTGTSSMMQGSDELGSETSFLSDLAISGMGPGTIQTDEGEADPITEAEVFMAYGRNQQAEEVLKKAREVSPGRVDIAAKLLEVYYNSKDGEKFEALAEETVGALQGDDALWGKVLRMGQELCPENVLFKGAAGSAAPAAAAAGGGEVLDIGLDLDELSTEMEGEGPEEELDLDLGLDFGDVEEGTSEETFAAEEEPSDFGLDLDLGAAEEESSEFDMDLGSFDLDTGTSGEAEEEEVGFDLDLGGAEEESSADLGMDFDLDLGGGDEAVAEDSGLDMDFDLGGLETGIEESVSTGDELGFDLDMGELTTETEEGVGEMSLDMDMDMGLDFETSTEADESISMDLDSELDELGEFGDLGDLGDLDGGEDEMTTKLDLAQAYAEMGDAEGARSMLEEVVAAGNSEQVQQAQALLSRI